MNKLLIDQLKRLEQKHHRQRSRNGDVSTTNDSPLKVYYGWAKINKIRKREAISVIFENQPGAGDHHRSGKVLPKLQETVYVRFQTEKEAQDAKGYNRMFTEYNIFLDDKSINGDLQKALDVNDEADKNNVSEEVRLIIRNALQRHYQIHHKT